MNIHERALAEITPPATGEHPFAFGYRIGRAIAELRREETERDAIHADLGSVRVVGMLQARERSADPTGRSFTSVSRGIFRQLRPEVLSGEAVDHSAFDHSEPASELGSVLMHEDFANDEAKERHER